MNHLQIHNISKRSHRDENKRKRREHLKYELLPNIDSKSSHKSNNGNNDGQKTQPSSDYQETAIVFLFFALSLCKRDFKFPDRGPDTNTDKNVLVFQ